MCHNKNRPRDQKAGQAIETFLSIHQDEVVNNLSTNDRMVHLKDIFRTCIIQMASASF